MGLETSLSIKTNRAVPNAINDGVANGLRGGRYGEIYALQTGGNPYHALADENSYRVAMSVPGTPIAFAVSAAISETAGNFLHIRNTETSDNSRAKRIYLHYIRLICTTVPASAVAGHAFVKLDTANRWSSGGTLLNPANPNIGSGSAASVAEVRAGALVTTAPSAAGIAVCRAVTRSAIPVVNDEFIFVFGSQDIGGGIQLAGTAAQRMMISCPPVIISGQGCACLQLWFPSNGVTPASFEVEVAYFER